jgi:hypothetical protein
MQSASSLKVGSRLSKGARTYYPNDYYNRVGYQKSEVSSKSRVDALGQRVRDRFNENLNYNDSIKTRGLTKGGLHGLEGHERSHAKVTPSQVSMSQTQSRFDQGSRAHSAIRSRRNTMKHANMDDLYALDEKTRAGDAISVITQDRLKRFNEIQGTVAGNATDEMEAQVAAVHEEGGERVDTQEGDEEAKDLVQPLR